MSHRRKGQDVEKKIKKAPLKIKKVSKNVAQQSNLEIDRFIVKEKVSMCLEKLNATKEKETGNPVAKKKKNASQIYKNLESDVSTSRNSSPLSDKISDSDLIILSEADSNVSEKVSPSSGYSGSSSGSSPCNNSISNLCDDIGLPSVELKSEQVPMSSKAKCNMSVTLSEPNLDVNKIDEILPFESAFVATLPSHEINYESDSSDILESNISANAIKDNFHSNVKSNIQSGSSLINISESSSSKQDIAVPNYLSPKKCLLSLMRQVNSISGSKESFICDRLSIEPSIKPPGFNYEENNFLNYAVNISMIRAANNYVKENSKSRIASFSTDVSESAWHNSIARSSDTFLNLSGNQLTSEDNESEISISSCKTSDIQPEFFDITFSEICSESFTRENLSDINVIPISPLNTNSKDLFSLSPKKLQTDNFEELNSINNKCLPEAKPKVKRKRKRCVWDTRKRRCKKRKNKETVPKLNNEFNAEALSKLNSEHDAEMFCDTCDENEMDTEAEDDTPDCEDQHSFKSKSNCSENDIVNRVNIKTTELQEENYCGNFTKSGCESSNNCLPSTTVGNSNQNNKTDTILSKPPNRKRKQNSSFENLERKSIVSCETNDKSESPTEESKSKKKKLSKSKLKNIKQLKCSVDLTILSQSSDTFSKSNHSSQKQPEIAVPISESIENICGKKINATSRSVFVSVKRLDDGILKRYLEDTCASENSRNKLDFENILQENSESIPTICDSNCLIQEQNSKKLVSENCSSLPVSSHSIPNIQESNACNNPKKVCTGISPIKYTNSKKDTDLLPMECLLNEKKSKKESENKNCKINDYCNTSPIILEKNLPSELQENEKTFITISKKRASNIHKNSENVMTSELQENEHIHKTGNSSETVSGIVVENVSNEESFYVNIVKSVLFDMLDKCDNSDCNSNFEISRSLSETNTNFRSGHSQSEIILSKESTSDLCQEMNDSLRTERCIDIQDSENSVSASKRLKIDNESSDTKSSNSSEPIILGLTEDDCASEFDQDDTRDDTISVCSTSFGKFSNYQHNLSFKSLSNSMLPDNFNTNLRELQKILSNNNKEDSSSDDDSDSDREYSRYKRSHERRPFVVQETSSNNLQVQSCENFDQIHSNFEEVAANSSKISSEASCSVKDVIVRIKELCFEENSAQAFQIAQTFISISSTSDVKRIYFQTLLSGLFSLFKNSSNSEISFSNIFDNVLKLMDKFEIYDKKLSSHFIKKCCNLPEFSPYAKKIFDGCKEKKIPLVKNAINLFCSTIKPEQLTISVLLEYIDYIKSVCKRKIPKIVIHSALEKSKTSKFAERHTLCLILYKVTSEEVDECNLKEFLQLCFKNSESAFVAEMFLKWSPKDDLSTCIYLALASKSEFMAEYYGKFAEKVHDENDMLNTQQKLLFGKIGTSLMIEAFSEKHLDSALDILNILHTYNVNYFEIELESCKCYFSQSFSDTDTFDMKVLPFLVVFIAVDICLHFERPKDAFTIFQDFSWISSDETFDEEIKMYVLKEKRHRLKKLVPQLNNKESIHQGWEALKILLTSVEQDLVHETLEVENEVWSEENSADTLDAEQSKETTSSQFVHSIYNEYLISFINFNELSSAFDLYQHSFGPKKDVFILKPYVLRGLVVAFSNGGMSENAEAVFRQGLLTNVYPIKKPEHSSIPWDLTIRSEWTVAEIKLVFDWFIEMLSPLLSAKPKETNFEKWFSIKIYFKITNQLESKIKCLMETDSDPKYYVNKAKLALQSMKPSLQYTEAQREEALLVTSDSLYSYWKSKCCYDSSTPSSHFERSSMLCPREMRLSFGEINASSEEEKSIFIEKNCLQPPNKLNVHSTESLVSDYIDEIRSKTSAGIITPYSPTTSPSNGFLNVSPSTSFMSQKETLFPYKNVQSNSKKLTDSIIRTRNPIRISDMYKKGYKINRGNEFLYASNHDNIRSKSATNINLPSSSTIRVSNDKSDSPNNKNTTATLQKRCNLKNSGVNTPKLKNKGVTSKIAMKRLQKFENNFSKQLPNGNIDMKNLTVSLAANSHTRTVSNNSQNLETVKADIIKKRISLNKSNNAYKSIEKGNSSNQSTNDVCSNIVVNVPRAEQTLKKPFTVSVTPSHVSEAPNSVSSEISPQNKDPDTGIFSNSSAQCKISKHVLKRNINLTFPSDLNETGIKVSKTELKRNINLTSPSDLNKTEIKVSKPVLNRNINLTSPSDLNKTEIKVSKPVLNRNINLTSPSDLNKTGIKVSKPVLNRNINLTSPSDLNKTEIEVSTTVSNSFHKKEHTSPKLTEQVIPIKTKTTKSFSAKIVSTTVPDSLTKKEHLCAENKLTEQAMADKARDTKSFLGKRYNPKEVEKITRFLQTKICLKYKNLSLKHQQEKAVLLSQQFIQAHKDFTRLDSKVMSHLNNFVKTHI